MKKKFTTVRIPGELKEMVYEMMDESNHPLFLVENNAVERFMDEEADVEEKYRYRKYDENYIERDQVLPLYITEDLSKRIEAYKSRINTTKSNIVLQALENDSKRWLEQKEKNKRLRDQDE